MTDDAMTIFMAFQSPGLEILGLTTVFGNVFIEDATLNALLLVWNCFGWWSSFQLHAPFHIHWIFFLFGMCSWSMNPLMFKKIVWDGRPFGCSCGWRQSWTPEGKFSDHLSLVFNFGYFCVLQGLCMVY